MRPVKYDQESNLTNSDDLGPRRAAAQTTDWKSCMKSCIVTLFGQASSLPCCRELKCMVAVLY